MALGYITDDGNGSIEPFRVRNPYIEFAYDGDEIIGMRLGFGEAKGYLSGDINQLTGNVNIGISGDIDMIVRTLEENGDDVPGLLGLAQFIGQGDAFFQVEAQLVDENGDPNNIRSTTAGIANGVALETDSNVLNLVDGLLDIFTSQNCEAAGLPSCFSLTTYRSLAVGDVNASDDIINGSLNGAARGLFLSFGHEDIQWRDLETNGIVDTAAGAFLNLPKYIDTQTGELTAPVNLTFADVFSGIERLATCFNSGNSGAVGC